MKRGLLDYVQPESFDTVSSAGISHPRLEFNVNPNVTFDVIRNESFFPGNLRVIYYQLPHTVRMPPLRLETCSFTAKLQICLQTIVREDGRLQTWLK